MGPTVEHTQQDLLGWKVLRALTAWLGAWPAAGTLRVVPSARRLLPDGSGQLQPLVGVATGPDVDGAVVLSVRPLAFAAVGALVDELAGRGHLRDRTELGRRLPEALGRPDQQYIETALRWTTAPTDLPRVGTWRRSDDPALPPWLRPLGPSVLVALDGRGRCMAGVGIKRHSTYAHELQLQVEAHAPATRLVACLVAEAAAGVLAEGALPLYRHDDHDAASAATAEAAGFPDRGWRWLGLGLKSC